MLQLFRNYNPFSVILLLLIAIGFKLAILIHPSLPLVLPGSQLVWKELAAVAGNILGRSPFLVTFFTLINIVGQALMLNRIANQHHLFPKSTYLPAMGYVMVTSLFTEWNYLSAPLVNNWLLLIALATCLRLHALPQSRKEIFNIGFCLGLASLLLFPHLVFILLLFLALSLLRPFNAGEWVVGLLGLVTPFYFLGSVLFLTDNLPLIHQVFQAGFSLPTSIQAPASSIPAFGMVLILLITGYSYLNGFMSRMLFQTKKMWWVIIASFLISLVAGIFTVAQGYNQWMAVLIPGTLVLTNTWFAESRKGLIRLLFYLWVAVIIFVQWYPKEPAGNQEKKLSQHTYIQHIKIDL